VSIRVKIYHSSQIVINLHVGGDEKFLPSEQPRSKLRGISKQL
jgi:hypothetical protein